MSFTKSPCSGSNTGARPRREDLPADANLCAWCSAKCCHYFALPIETPLSYADFDFIRWYLLHEAATVFVEEETWYLMVHTTCKHLQDDNRCGIYATRPDICRQYSTAICEYEDSWTYEQYFETPEQIVEFCEVIFAPDHGESIRTPRPDRDSMQSLSSPSSPSQLHQISLPKIHRR